MSKWIAIIDRLPPEGEDVLLYMYGMVVVGRKREGQLGEPSSGEFRYRANCCGRYGTPTYWMPLPDAPIDVAKNRT